MPHRIVTINPSTDEVIETYPLMDPGEVQRTVRRAHEAFQASRDATVEERVEPLSRLADGLREHADELSTLMATEMGKVLDEARQEVELCAQICEYTVERAPDVLEEEERSLEDGRRAIITRQPMGVILGIQPWNFPLYQVIRYAVPNLAAGNTVLLKHAECVWGMASRIASLCDDAGLAAGRFEVLRCSADALGGLYGDDRVRGVTFTGSSATGAQVARSAADHLKPTVLELGSNDAYLILEDADLDTAVEACIQGRYNNVGQTCVAAKRLIVVRSRYDAFREAFVARARALRYGDPTREEVDMGPMARRDLRDTLHQQVRDSVHRGARCLIGGEIPDRPGFFYPPTVLDQLSEGMPAYDDELFGPVASLIPADDADHAMEIANASRFGLGGGIFSADRERAIRLAARYFDTGMVNVNGYGLAKPNLPFGGVKDSGYGREHGGFGMREFVNVKAVHVNG